MVVDFQNTLIPIERIDRRAKQSVPARSARRDVLPGALRGTIVLLSRSISVLKASNPQVMVQAYRLLIQQMEAEFGECYPLHLGVTEAGDGEDGRIKSAAGIGTLMEDGIGDTIRVSLTEDPELEIPVCKDLVKRYEDVRSLRSSVIGQQPADYQLSYIFSFYLQAPAKHLQWILLAGIMYRWLLPI